MADNTHLYLISDYNKNDSDGYSFISVFTFCDTASLVREHLLVKRALDFKLAGRDENGKVTFPFSSRPANLKSSAPFTTVLNSLFEGSYYIGNLSYRVCIKKHDFFGFVY